MLFQTPRLSEREAEVIAEIEAIHRQFDVPLPKQRDWPGLPWRAIQGGNAEDEADPETLGYADALGFVLHLADVGDFAYDAGVLRALHYLMTRHAPAKNPGRWRRGSMLVASQTHFADVVDYRAPDWRQVPLLVAELVTLLNAEDGMPSYVRAAMAHLNLAAIHPFLDANGRMARALHTLVLARGGIWLPAFSSIDEYLSVHRARYVKALQDTHGGAFHPGRDARPWLRFCLRSHRYQAIAVQQKMRQYDRLWDELEAEAKRQRLPESTIAALAGASSGEEEMDHDQLERLVGAELLNAVAARTIGVPVPDEDPFAP